MKIRRLLFLLAATAMMVVSCAKEQAGPSEQKVHIKLTASSEPLKTYLGKYGDDDNVILWGTNEQMFLSVLPGTGDSFIGFGYSDPMSASDGKPVGEFSFDFTVKTSPSYMYTAIYPALAMNEGNMNPKDCRITLPIIQKPTATSYDPKTCILQAKPEVFSSVQTHWKASFRRAAAINKLTLTNLKEGVKTVYITAPGHHLAGVRSMNLATGFSNDLEPDDTPVNIRYDVPLGAGTADVWFCSWGAEIPEGEKLVIMASTDTKAYTREIAANSKGISFKEGCLNCLSVDMSKATESEATPDFKKYDKKSAMPGVKNAIVIEGLFNPSTDDVKIIYSGSMDDVAAELKEITKTSISIYTHVNRVGQTVQYILDRGGKQYELTDPITIELPTGVDGYVPDAQFRTAITRPLTTAMQDGGGFGLSDDAFDVCGILNVDEAAKVKCEETFYITGWGFTSIQGIEAFKNIGKKGWDQPILRMWGNGGLVDVDLSGFEAFVCLNLSSCPSLKRVVLGPNMGGLENVGNNPKLEEIDISNSKYVTNLQFNSNVPSLKLLDLRYQPDGYSMAAAGNIDMRGLSSISDADISNLVIKINSEYLVRHDDVRGWRDGIYAAWKRGAKIQVFTLGSKFRKVGDVPAYTADPNALSPNNGTKDAEGVWHSSNKWPYQEDLPGKVIAILGDSYSTYQGTMPAGYVPYYPYPAASDLTSPDQTWWNLYAAATNSTVMMNSSWSGTVFGYANPKYPADPVLTDASSFIERAKDCYGERRPANAEKPDVIFVFGGTNDSWSGCPIGDVKYSDWTYNDLKNAIPAFCFVLDHLKKYNPDAKIINITNTNDNRGAGTKAEICQKMAQACAYYGIDNIVLPADLSKDSTYHPNVAGMKQIRNCILSYYSLPIPEEKHGPLDIKGKKVSILGDSYSTFSGYIPQGYSPYYPCPINDVTSVGQTWWGLLFKELGAELAVNCSYGGTIFGTKGYQGADTRETCFITRAKRYLGEERVQYTGSSEKPAVIFLMGGTNDSWQGIPLGECKYSGWTDADLENVIPAYCYLLNYLKTQNPGTRIINLINMNNSDGQGGIKQTMVERMEEACHHYDIESVRMKGISKDSSFHPDANGMETMASEIITYFGN